MTCEYTRNIKSGLERFMYATCALLPVMVLHIHLVSFYVVVINGVFYQSQMGSWEDIEGEQYQLAVDEQTAEYFIDFETVNFKSSSILS